MQDEIYRVALELRARRAAQPRSCCCTARTARPRARSPPASCARSSTTRRSTRARSIASTGSSPAQSTLRGSIGFGGRTRGHGAADDGSYAHLADDQIDARLFIEVRDHPLFLLPRAAARDAPRAALRRTPGASEPPPTGCCAAGSRTRTSRSSRRSSRATTARSRRCCATCRSSATSSRGATASARSRSGPQLSVDAGERQITADRRLAALPSLAAGDDALRGVRRARSTPPAACSSSRDLLKRPLDAFKYLQLTVETGEVALRSQNVQLNCVMIGERQRGAPGRLPRAPRVPELPRAPRADPRAVPAQLRSTSSRSTTRRSRRRCSSTSRRTRREMAALFAVLTRMRQPNPDRYAKPLARSW